MRKSNIFKNIFLKNSRAVIFNQINLNNNLKKSQKMMNHHFKVTLIADILFSGLNNFKYAIKIHF